MNKSIEIDFLLSEVSRFYGGEISSASDFDKLSEAIETAVGEPLSVSTLKRLWGYVNQRHKPRYSTLNILSQYVGRKDFMTLCLDLQETSEFLYSEKVLSSSLSEGAHIALSWQPNRNVELEYNGDNTFAVVDAGTSKLKEGDLVETSVFIKGQPLYFGRIVRDGNELPAYVAGKSMGLTSITVY